MESIVNRWVPSENRGAENDGLQKEIQKSLKNSFYSDSE